MFLRFLLIALITRCTVQGQDLEWYKSEMANNVVTPYILAYTALENSIISPLLKATNASDGTELANRLNCGVTELNTNLSQALMYSDRIRQTNDETVLQLVEAISNWEIKIRQGLHDLDGLRVQIESMEKQVDVAEDGVKQKEAGLAAANDEVRNAESGMADARNCQRKRRRRFFGNIFSNGILKPFCSLFNHNGIRNSFQRQTDADREYESARNQLDTYQDTLHDLKTQQSDLTTQITDTSTQIQTHNSTLSQFKEQQLIVTTINEQIKEIILHLTSIFDSSSILKEVIQKLLDFELLITPLNAIYKNMADNGLISNAAETTPISDQTIRQIRMNIDRIAIILPNIPYNVNGTSTC